MALSAFTQGLIITTAYDTLGEEGLSFSLNEGHVTTLYTTAELLTIMPNVIKKVKTLKNVIYSGSAAAVAEKAEVVKTILAAGNVLIVFILLCSSFRILLNHALAYDYVI